jgi:hypothetical protein
MHCILSCIFTCMLHCYATCIHARVSLSLHAYLCLHPLQLPILEFFVHSFMRHLYLKVVMHIAHFAVFLYAPIDVPFSSAFLQLLQTTCIIHFPLARYAWDIVGFSCLPCPMVVPLLMCHSLPWCTHVFALCLIIAFS